MVIRTNTNQLLVAVVVAVVVLAAVSLGAGYLVGTYYAAAQSRGYMDGHEVGFAAGMKEALRTDVINPELEHKCVSLWAKGNVK